MLSIQRMKELLSDMNLFEEEAREIRDSFRLLPENILEKWQREARGLNKSMRHAGWFGFFEKLLFKSEEAGKEEKFRPRTPRRSVQCTGKL